MARTRLKLPSEFTFSTVLHVRIDDINYAGHLSNEKILALVHEARVRFFSKLGFTELDVDGCGTIMTDAVVVYKSQSFHGDSVRIEMTPADFHKYGCDFLYKLTNVAGGKEIAHAKTGMVFFDYERQRIVPTPELFVRAVRPKSLNSTASA